MVGSSVVTRPCVRDEPHAGNQMPLRLRRVAPAPAGDAEPPEPPEGVVSEGGVVQRTTLATEVRS